MDSGAALEQFLLLSKSAKGRASVALIEKVVNSPGIFVFGELLDMPNVQAVRARWPPRSGPHPAAWELKRSARGAASRD